MVEVNREALTCLVAELSQAEAESLDKVGPITSRLHNAIDDLCKALHIPNVWEARTDEENKAIKAKACPTCHCAIIE